MGLQENIERINLFKNELDVLRPITPEQEQKVMQKFRLDWNYHSSNIEGNTLTYGETKALILFGHTAQAKPLKDHLEISGHDEAIKSIEDVIKNERPLTESFIRELHKIILKNPYKVDAITSDGNSTKKWVKVGQYKTSPNHVLTKTGEIFRFATPEETPAKMHDLLKWLEENYQAEDTHPVILATELHYRFIRIHPFDDGNGRIARLLMNFVLMQNGYPPAIIKTEDKSTYLQALEQADAGNLEFFFEYISELVIHSLDLMIRAANGEEVEKVGDLDKKLKLLKKRVGNGANSSVKIKRNSEVIKVVLEKSIKPLLSELEEKLPEFDSFFKSREIRIQLSKIRQVDSNFLSGFKKLFESRISKVLEENTIVDSIIFSSTFIGLINSNRSISLKGLFFTISFFENVYEISGVGIKTPINKLYDSILEDFEIELIINQLLSWQYILLENLITKTEK